MAKKIKLTFLWTDEKTIAEDFFNKVSTGMETWAREFYTRQGFDLDVDPPADKRTSVVKVWKHALVQSDGVRPDFRSLAAATEGDEFELSRLNKKIADFDKDIANVEAIVAKLQKAANDLQAAGKVLEDAAAAATNAATVKDLTDKAVQAKNGAIAALDGVIQASRTVAAAKEQRRSLVEEREAMTARHRAKAANVEGYDGALRAQMWNKFDHDRIGDERRLSVVFSKPWSPMAMRRPSIGSITKELLNEPRIAFSGGLPIFLWPYPYIIIDIDRPAPSALSHEIVHAAGHRHPENVKQIAKRVVGIKLPPRPATASSGRPPFSGAEPQYDIDVVEIPGGYFDGEKNDIMNHARGDISPAAAVLNDKDKALLEKPAFFVVP